MGPSLSDQLCDSCLWGGGSHCLEWEAFSRGQVTSRPLTLQPPRFSLFLSRLYFSVLLSLGTDGRAGCQWKQVTQPQHTGFDPRSQYGTLLLDHKAFYTHRSHFSGLTAPWPCSMWQFDLIIKKMPFMDWCNCIDHNCSCSWNRILFELVQHLMKNLICGFK